MNAKASTAPDTLETNQAKQFVTGEIGGKIDAKLTEAKDRVQKCKGGVAAFAQGSAACEALHTHTKNDFNDPKSELHKCGGEPALIRAYVNKYITRCSEALLNLKVQAKASEVQALGAVPELEEAVKIIQRYHDSATVRVGQFQSKIAEDKDAKEEPSRPGDGSARKDLQARMDAEKAKKAKKKAAKKPKKKARKRKR
jgi:hypothetical protein